MLAEDNTVHLFCVELGFGDPKNKFNRSYIFPTYEKLLVQSQLAFFKGAHLAVDLLV